MWKYHLNKPAHCRDIKVGQRIILYENELPNTGRTWTINNIDIGMCSGVHCGWNTKNTAQFYDAECCRVEDSSVISGIGTFSPRYLGICSRCKHCISVDSNVAYMVVWL